MAHTETVNVAGVAVLGLCIRHRVRIGSHDDLVVGSDVVGGTV